MKFGVTGSGGPRDWLRPPDVETIHSIRAANLPCDSAKPSSMKQTSVSVACWCRSPVKRGSPVFLPVGMNHELKVTCIL